MKSWPDAAISHCHQRKRTVGFRSKGASRTGHTNDLKRGIMVFRRSTFTLAAGVVLSIGLLAAPLWSEVELSGEQDGYYDRNDYLVTSNVVVKPGRTLTFAPGAIIRFQRYTGLIVEGSLVCKGTLSSPIIFTSVNDRVQAEGVERRALPFDWNGIEVHDSSPQAEFDYARVLYSSFGIQVVSSNTSLKVTNTVFRDNGNAHFSIGDSVVIVADNTPFTFVKPEPAGQPVKPVEKSAHEPLKPAKETSKITFVNPAKPWKLPVQVGVGAIALGGGILWAVSGAKFSEYNRKYHDTTTDPGQVDEYGKKCQQMQALGYTGMALTILCGTGFTITFFF